MTNAIDPRATTMADIRQELRAARKKYPGNDRTLDVLEHFVKQLRDVMMNSRGTVGDEITIRTTAISAAVMAIRVCEEGQAGMKYTAMVKQRAASAGPLFDIESRLPSK